MPVTGVKNVRIMFTVVAAGARELDVIVHAGAYAVVSEVAELLGAERLYAGRERLIPTDRASEAIRDGSRVGLDRPAGEPAWPAAPANTGAVPPLATTRDGAALLVRRPPRLAPAPPHAETFTLPSRPASRSLLRRRERQADDEERARIEKAADDARAADEAWWRAEYPDPAVLFDIAAAPGSRLWERRPGDPDFLTLRAGNGTRPSLISVHDPATGRERRLTLTDVPLTVSLASDSGVLGVACPPDAAAELTWAGPDGPGGPARAVCRWLVAQLAVLRSPADLRVCLLTDQSDHDDWAWARWLPHCRPPREKTALTWVGNDEGTSAARIADVLGIIEGRRRADQPYPVIVVVFDGWSRFRSEPGVSQILRAGPEVGVYAICADAELRALPEECRTIIEPDGQGEFEQLRIHGRESGGGLPDLVDPGWCEGIARALAPLRDGDAIGRPGLGEVNKLPDLLNLTSSAPEAIKRRWRAEGGMAAAVIGESADGAFSIDLRRDGPHALIAGATGSGKSELLQTIVASYAAASPPDAITFLLIDYKGGSAFKDCVDLPHTVGLIVDFDPYEAERVLTSLAAELRRRELLLYAADAKDVDDYIALRGRRAGLKPLPRLVIMVDEFASLTRELPDFISGLMNIAQRGRSLGVHLILATQRPAGVVSQDIRANTNLRIALRLADPVESQDVIEAPDAASIPATIPGRGYVRVGPRVPTLVQFSRVSGPAPRARNSPWLAPVAWEDLGHPEPRPSPERDEAETVTSLAALVAAVREASDSLRFLPPHQPWLPGLPGAVPLSELGEPIPDGNGELPLVPFALEDVPSEQVQRMAAIDFSSFGHLLAAGDRLSGRSQLLRTIAGAIASAISCADVHMYGIDPGDGALLPLADLPHCGAVVTLAQSDRVVRLIGRLGQELERRQVLFAETRSASISGQRLRSSLEQRLPHILVVLDRWERFTETLDDDRHAAAVDTVMRIAQQGPRFGMHLVITGNRSVLSGRLGAYTEEKLAFRLADRDDYSLIGLRPRDVPGDIPAGRALRAGLGTALQVALLDGEPTGAGQVAALRLIAAAARRRDADVPLAQRPFGIDTADLVSDRFHVGDAQGRPVGREDVLAWLRDRHAAGGSVALLGPRRAGKTWVLRELERRLAEDGYQQVHGVTIQLPSSRVETKDELARILDQRLRDVPSPADALLDQARRASRPADRLAYLLDEVGRLAAYGPAAVSWLRDLGQAGAWLVYTGTEKDWQEAVRQALKAPGSSFGNDVDARALGPLNERDAVVFLTGTAANLRVNLSNETAEDIIATVGAWPFYLQVVGDAVVRAVQADDLEPLWKRGALTDLIGARLLDGWMTHFKSRWAEIGPAGRSALLQDPGQQPGGLAPGQRDDLRDVGLLLPGDRWLADRPFFDWVARNATALRDGERR